MKFFTPTFLKLVITIALSAPLAILSFLIFYMVSLYALPFFTYVFIGMQWVLLIDLPLSYVLACILVSTYHIKSRSFFALGEAKVIIIPIVLFFLVFFLHSIPISWSCVKTPEHMHLSSSSDYSGKTNNEDAIPVELHITITERTLPDQLFYAFTSCTSSSLLVLFTRMYIGISLLGFVYCIASFCLHFISFKKSKHQVRTKQKG